MIVGLFRFILFAVLAYLIMAVVRAFRRIGRQRREPEPPRKITGIMVKDEICNTYLPKEQALREVRGGRDHYFCSRECRDRFLAEKRPPA